ncbi:MAG: hypothetical protein EP301_14010 [Gammaproteobacteria bacterium]|jgi:DNA-binding transcriptional ArsR family regulator|nr:MAG: hypothetical protein EP301_14010 [Gammaproteobacteria bacterium]
MERREDSPDDIQEAEEVRYRTLTQMEKVLRVLVDRHGARATVGEMLAIYAAMARLCKQDQVSIAEISEATGLAKQNLSRWAHKRIGDSISLRVNEDDQRVHDVVMMDSLRGQENIERLAELFKTDSQSD